MYQRVVHRRYRKKRITVLFLILVLALLATWYLTQQKFDFFVKKDKHYDAIIEKSAKRHCLDACLLKAVIWQESRFKRDSVGSKGEIGLMQIMDGATSDWARKTNRELPDKFTRFNPEINIEIGSWYLAKAVKYWYKKGYQDFEVLALCEYNAGRGNAKKWLPKSKKGQVTPLIKFKSTKEYVKSVMKKYHEYLAKRKVK